MSTVTFAWVKVFLKQQGSQSAVVRIYRGETNHKLTGCWEPKAH